MQIRQEAHTGFRAELDVIPAWAWTVAALGFVAGPVYFAALAAGGHGPPITWLLALMGLAAGSMLAGYFLLLGYVTRDARRRGMSVLVWTLVAIFIPNGLGILLYFILRQPLQTMCPQCGSAVQMGFHFCPNCSHRLGLSCPKCQRAVSGEDTYCPYCGTALRAAAQPDQGSGADGGVRPTD
jgi:RNA polymerase subunit RPABC4/transcription elongation factor Spt4